MSRSVRFEVCLVDEGWTSVAFEDIEAIHVAAAPGDDGLTLTLIGVCDERPNQVETNILDVAERHRGLLDDELPAVDSVTLPVALRDSDIQPE